MKNVKTYTHFINEENNISKTFLQIYKNNNKSDYYNYIVLKGDELYNVRVMTGEKMSHKYIGKIDKSKYSVNGQLVKNPSLKMISILQNNLKIKHENS
jgi:hypothetical protein